MVGLPRLEASIRDALRRSDLADTSLMVAVSGGPDSIALLHGLYTLRQSMGLTLHVAHFNHDFRGEEAEEDARFVARVAAGLGLPAVVERGDPVAYQREHGISSFEAAARELRYDFLASVAHAAGAAVVALGHTTDDQAETVLMHILRGSGLDGLRGMAELSRWRGSATSLAVALFRPLLGITKGQARSYCRVQGLSFREDSSNLDPRFTRNRLRLQLIPTLKTYNPRAVDALLRLARSASREVDYLEATVKETWSQVAKEEDDSIELDRAILTALHPAVRRRVLRQAYIKLVGDARRLEEAHLEAMAALAEAPAGKLVTLPLGLKLLSRYGKLVIGLLPQSVCPYPPLEGEHQLVLPCATAAGSVITGVAGWRISAQLLPGSVPAPGDDPFTAYLDLRLLGPTLSIRTRRPGDRFHPSGMATEKKLQDFYVDRKVPREWRDRIPLVVSEPGIAWVVGYRVADWARVSKDSGEVLEVAFTLEQAPEAPSVRKKPWNA